MDIGYAKKIKIRSVFHDTCCMLRELVELFILRMYNLCFGVAIQALLSL